MYYQIYSIQLNFFYKIYPARINPSWVPAQRIGSHTINCKNIC